MKAMVNGKACNGCTICNIICPEVFNIMEDGKAESFVEVIPKNIEQICMEAADECPSNAISIDYEDNKAGFKRHLEVLMYR